MDFDFPVDSSSAVPHGGDPRGSYTPHAPFVYYFGPAHDSLTSNTCSGTLGINGPSASGGTYALSIISIVGGTVGFNGRLPLADTTSVTGSWSTNGVTIVFTTASMADTVEYTVDAQGLYLIVPIFYYYPPVSRLFHQYDPGIPGSTVWVYKK